MKESVLPFLVVGCGGFAGSVLRYGLALAGQRWSVTFPHGTLWANLLGCLVLGAVTGLSVRSGAVPPTVRLLLATGLCGGFTTMSTFTYELFKFMQSAEYVYAAGYFALTVAGCLASFGLGLYVFSAMMKG